MASKHPISRLNSSQVGQHKQFASSITTPREQYFRCDAKPPVSTHTCSRPSSAKIRDLAEKCDVLHQDLESDRLCIAQLHKDVTQTSEVHKQLCVGFGRKIAGVPMMVQDIQARLTELVQKLTRYYADIVKLKENSDKLKRRVMQLSGRRVAITKKQKDIKEQLNAPKNLIKRPKAQESLSLQQFRVTTDPELNKSIESIKERKSDIKTQFSHYQSELDKLIKTEKRLKEIINELQASHNTVKQDIQKIRENTASDGKKHKEVQKIATKPEYQSSNAHILHSPSQSRSNLEAMKNKARNQLELEVRRASLDIKEAELQKVLKDKESLEEKITNLESQLNDAIKTIDKFNEQLAHTGAVWSNCVEERDKKIAQLEKSLIDVNSHQKQLEYEHQIEELNLKVESISNDCASKLSQANKNHESVVAQKDLQFKKCQERIAEMEKSLNDMNSKAMNHQKQLEHQIKELNLKAVKISNDCTSKLNEANKNHESVVSQRDSELKKYQEKLKESLLNLAKAEAEIKALQAAITTKSCELNTCHMSLNKKSEENAMIEANLNRKVEELRQRIQQLENKEKYLELTKTEGHNLLQEAMKQKDEQLKQKDKELKSLQQSLLKYEERSFRFTNAFTSAGEGSVLEISKRYRHLQHNKRAAAARALKKVQNIDARDHLCNQIMSAFEAAKSMVLDQARHCIENNLFKLQANDRKASCSKELLQGCMVLLSCIQEDKEIKNKAIGQIHEQLMDGKPLPSEVEDYYKSLAELVWCAVARPIPMIIAKSPDTYCKAYHELKDGEDVEDGRAVGYIYPVLYTSNEWPRQVALEGRVVLKRHNS